MPPLTPLVRPGSFFAERDFNGLRVLVVLVAVGISVLIIWYAAGWIVTDRVDGTVRVDNPDRPSDTFCDSNFDYERCDQPRKIEKDVDSLFWDVWGRIGGQLLLGLSILWVLLGVLLHAGSWLARGEAGLVPSFGVAAWGLVPFLAGGIVPVVVLSVTFDPITVMPANQDTVFETAKQSFRVLDSKLWITSLLTAAWTAVIWRCKWPSLPPVHNPRLENEN